MAVTPDVGILAAALTGAIAHAGVDPSLKDQALQNPLLSAIANRRGSYPWRVEHAG